MTNKKKAVVALIVSVLVALSLCGVAYAVNSKAQNRSVDLGWYSYKTTYTQTKWPDYTYTKEGYTNIKSWQLDVENVKDGCEVLANSIQEEYSGYLTIDDENKLKDIIDEVKKAYNLTDLNNCKTQLEALLDTCKTTKEDLEKAQAESAAQFQAINENYSTNTASYNSTTTYAATSPTWSDAESAKAFIVGKESGGNYSATNGRYYGAYQLDSSYLNGDYSAENQDKVAEEYVNNRYGGWEGAASFWESHGWY